MLYMIYRVTISKEELEKDNYKPKVVKMWVLGITIFSETWILSIWKRFLIIRY